MMCLVCFLFIIIILRGLPGRYNTMQFFKQSTERLVRKSQATFKPSIAAAAASTNVMDVWIMSITQSLVRNVRHEMESYFLYKVGLQG